MYLRVAQIYCYHGYHLVCVRVCLCVNNAIRVDSSLRTPVRRLIEINKMATDTRTQSRSQSMPVRGLVVGIALAKPHEICNFIGCREINETDIEVNGNARFLRELCVDSWIMRNDVNKKLT